MTGKLKNPNRQRSNSGGAPPNDTAAYGCPANLADAAILKRLLTLNLQRSG